MRESACTAANYISIIIWLTCILPKIPCVHADNQKHQNIFSLPVHFIKMPDTICRGRSSTYRLNIVQIVDTSLTRRKSFPVITTWYKLGCANAGFPLFLLGSSTSVITSVGYSRTISWPPWAQHLFDVIVF